jgi:general secretion pathway protein K
MDELLRVNGMTPGLLAVLRPHLTLFGPAEPDPAFADPQIAAALALVAQLSPGTGSQGADDVITTRIRSVAQGPGNALATRTAVARIGQSMPNGYALMTWSNGEE